MRPEANVELGNWLTYGTTPRLLRFGIKHSNNIQYRNEDGTFAGDTDKVIKCGGVSYVIEEKNWLCDWYIPPSRFDELILSRFTNYETRHPNEKVVRIVIACGVKKTKNFERLCKEHNITLIHLPKAVMKWDKRMLNKLVIMLLKYIKISNEFTDFELDQLDLDDDRVLVRISGG